MSAEEKTGPALSDSKFLFELSDHLVVEEIARGGMGIVYRAQQLDPPRAVALKMLLPHQLGSAEIRERFDVEVRAIALLEHPAILPIYQVGEHEGMPFFTMKLATGGTLASRAGEFHGRFREIAELMVTLADAVHFAHERGVLHRDLKPGNILFDEAGRPFVSDFGLAKFTQFNDSGTPALTRSIHLLGTPQFFPPEVAGGGVARATTAGDLYSLGAILYELLAQRPPFVGEGLTALLKAIVEQEPPRPSTVLPGVPHDLEIVCLKCLAKEPAQRYGSARELADDLRRWLSGRPILARPVSLPSRIRQWTGRNPALAAVSLLLFLALLGGAILQVRDNRNLRSAFARTRLALQQSLVAQAGLNRASGSMGQRFGTLELVRRAASLGENTSTDELRMALRTEIAGALALPDLRPISRWPVYVGHFEGSVEFSRELGRYVTAAAKGGLAVYSTTNRELLRTIPGASENPAILFRFSPDAHWVAATFQDGHAEVHALDEALPSRSFIGQPALRTAAEFLPDNRSVIISGQAQGAVLVDLIDGKERSLMPSRANSTWLSVDPLGERALVLLQNALQVIRIADGSNVWSRPWTNGGRWAAWSPDGTQLAVASAEPLLEVSILDAVTSKPLQTFRDHDVAVGRVAFHPDGRSVVSTSWDGRLVWRELAKEGLRFLSQGGPRLLRFSPDGRKLAYEPSHGEAGLYEVSQSTVLQDWKANHPPDEETFMICVSPDGRLAASSSARGVHLWDTVAREEVTYIPLPSEMWFVMVLFHPDGKSLLYSGVGIGINKVELTEDRKLPGRSRWATGRTSKLGSSNDSIALEFAPDGRSLIVGENKQAMKNQRRSPDIWLWPEADPARGRKLAGDWPLLGYHLTKDGRWGLTSHFIDPDITVWDPMTGQRVKSLGLAGPVQFDLPPDGHWIFASTREEYQLVEIGTWRTGAHWPAQFAQQHYRFWAFTPDSKLVATAEPNGRVDLRTLPDGVELLHLPSPKATQIKGMQFSADATRLFLLTAAGGIREWNLSELRQQLAALGLDWKSATAAE